jgi:hypothetical protein
MREATEAQKEFLAANLNTAYFVAALTIDTTGAEMVQDLITGQRVYLDTNFIGRRGDDSHRLSCERAAILRVLSRPLVPHACGPHRGY